MAKPTLVQDNWSSGAKQDQGFGGVPANGAWYLQNVLPGIGGFSLGLRGGYTYASCDLRTTTSSMSRPTKLGFVNDGTPYIYSFGTGGEAIRTSTTTFASTALQSYSGGLYQNPITFDSKLILTYSSSALPQYYTSSATAVTTLSSSAPLARCAAAYKARLVIANDSVNKNRVWFSGIYDTTSSTAWSVGATGRWIDTSYPVTALAALSNSMLVFSESFVERIRGNTPGGGGQAGDIVLEPLFSTGAANPAHVCVAEDRCYFLNRSGVFMTDGANLTDLAKEGGMRRYWAAQSSIIGNLCIGYAGGWLFVMGENERGWLIDVEKRAWFGVQFDASSKQGFYTLLSVQDQSDVVYSVTDGTTGSVTDARVIKLTSMLEPSSAHDADGGTIVGIVQTRPYMDSPTKKRFRRMFLQYEATDPGSANPYVTVAPNFTVVPEPGASLDTTTASATLAETSGLGRSAAPLGRTGSSVAFYLSTAGKGYPMGIQAIEIEAHELESSRR